MSIENQGRVYRAECQYIGSAKGLASALLKDFKEVGYSPAMKKAPPGQQKGLY